MMREIPVAARSIVIPCCRATLSFLSPSNVVIPAKTGMGEWPVAVVARLTGGGQLRRQRVGYADHRIAGYQRGQFVLA